LNFQYSFPVTGSINFFVYLYDGLILLVKQLCHQLLHTASVMRISLRIKQSQSQRQVFTHCPKTRQHTPASALHKKIRQHTAAADDNDTSAARIYVKYASTSFLRLSTHTLPMMHGLRRHTKISKIPHEAQQDQ
jgi:hypothetical protein